MAILAKIDDLNGVFKVRVEGDQLSQTTPQKATPERMAPRRAGMVESSLNPEALLGFQQRFDFEQHQLVVIGHIRQAAR